MAATERDGAVTALVVANNLMAIRALGALAHHRRRVPEDVALDDPFWAELVQPSLTTLAQPVRAMADAAVRLLHERFPFELRRPGSSGPGASAA